MKICQTLPISRDLTLRVKGVRALHKALSTVSDHEKSQRLQCLARAIKDLFGREEDWTREHFRDIFRLVDNVEDRELLKTLRDFLKIKLGCLQSQMEEYLQTHDDWDPVLRAQMNILLGSEIRCSRLLPSFVKEPEEVRRWLVYIIPKRYLDKVEHPYVHLRQRFFPER